MYYNTTYVNHNYITLYIIKVSRKTGLSNSDRQSLSSVPAITGRANGTTSQGRGRGTARGTARGRGRDTAHYRGCGATMHVKSTTSDTDHALPEVVGT